MKRLFGKIIDSFKQADEEEKLEIEKQKCHAMPKFEIPSQEVLQLVEGGKALTMWQIKEVLSYIKSNYYFCDNKRLLDDFAFEWTLCGGDVDEINERIETACSSIVFDLSNGRRISPADALWFSSKIYTDGVTSDKTRIITKKVDKNCAIFDVETQEKCPSIQNEVNELRKQLKINNYSKTFALGN